MESRTPRPVILVTSFGTTFESTRSITIGAIESVIAERFPEYEVRRAFTSNNIRRILLERDKIKIDSVPEALEKLAAEGVKKVVVMPTHMLEGDEYDNKIVNVAKEFEGRFEDIRVGRALLTNAMDYRHMAAIIDDATAAFKAPKTARVFMGHGTEHKANEGYAKLQQTIKDRGIKDMFIGTVEAEPTLEDMVKIVKDGGYSKVVLSPLM
ncbi:MAG: sirohydrochlorin cobaltochelatase, partial [Firmicutes bacterium]|nr:sirohydrochlorin cobaltochelatase [Bacillota bacterium]